MPVDTPKPTSAKVGSYELLEKIAEGGMGTVYKARQQDNGQLVALKILPPHLAKNPVMLRRFEQEYNAAHQLDHPNLVKALDFGREGESPFLVMEFVEGESLGARLERELRLSEAEAIRIISQVAQGLQKAHKQGMVHRDVKPDNILLMPDGGVKLTDMGLVKELETDLNLTRTGRGLGTPHFMAPEQFRNAKYADSRCDIYSLAATLYMMVTGELPFKSGGPLDAWMKKINNDLPHPRQLVPEVTERLDWAIRRSMSADPNQRARNCREFIEDLTGQSTRQIASIPGALTEIDNWHLVFRDDEGVVHTVKGTMQSIRRSLREGLLGDASNVRASRNQGGPFDLLRNHPEFRDLVVEPASISPPSKPTAPAASSRTPTPVNPASQKETTPNTPPVVSLPANLPAVGPNPAGPLIDLGPQGSGNEWIRWLILVLVAVGAGAAIYLLMPYLSTFRLPR